jgi:hypothetical protein
LRNIRAKLHQASLILLHLDSGRLPLICWASAARWTGDPCLRSCSYLPPLSQKSKAGMVLDFAGWRRDRTQRPAQSLLPGFACRNNHVLNNGQSMVLALFIHLKTRVQISYLLLPYRKFKLIKFYLAMSGEISRDRSHDLIP